MQILPDESATITLAGNIGLDLHSGSLVLLRGPMGAGKTVFARALIRALSQNPALEIPSPTFTLLQTYDTPRGPVHHYDLYRLGDPFEIHELGWEESLAYAITLVEWPERLGPCLPPRHLDIRLANVDNKPGSRQIEITRVGI